MVHIPFSSVTLRKNLSFPTLLDVKQFLGRKYNHVKLGYGYTVTVDLFIFFDPPKICMIPGMSSVTLRHDEQDPLPMGGQDFAAAALFWRKALNPQIQRTCPQQNCWRAREEDTQNESHQSTRDLTFHTWKEARNSDSFQSLC